MAARMVVDDFLPEEGAVDMHVDFRRCDAFVAEHLLDGTKVGAALKQVGGEGMPQGVRADALLDAARLTKVADNVEYHHAGERTASPVEEKNVGSLALYA